MKQPTIKTALVSVSDKAGLADFAVALHKLGIAIISSSGTARYLADNGIPVTGVSSITGFPEILGGRVKTLHPKITGAILAKSGSEADSRDLAEHGISEIDLVIVNFYPFEKTVLEKNASLESAVESIDIGGPTLLRSAAKNFGRVAAVCDPADYTEIISELEISECALSGQTREKLAAKAFAYTARYDTAICNYLASRFGPENIFPENLNQSYKKVQDLRYGENPHQKAALYSSHSSGAGLPGGRKKLWGKELSYNNILDIEAAADLVCEFSGRTVVAILKHNNPCGVAVAKTNAGAFSLALSADPVSAFGGVACFNSQVGEEEAGAMNGVFLEVVVAPGFSPAALDVLKKKKNLRIIEEPLLSSNVPAGEIEFRSIRGGLLAQQKNEILYSGEKKVVTKRKPSSHELSDLDFAWKVCKHVKSNAVVYAKESRTIGVGAGQMSRVDSAKLAAMKASASGLDTLGCVMASDAFFPFRDGVDEAAKAGITAIIQPGGSIRDAEVISAADEHGMAMVFTGTRQTWH